MYLEKIESPADLRAVAPEELTSVAAELRELIIDTVSKNGGHLAASLGTVELILALHYVFDVPQDSLVFDVGHQAYAHKILTGRREHFRTLRQFGGCAGFPAPYESEHDACVAGHAGTAISAALGISTALGKARSSHKAIAVVGDGSLNCGISLEGLNNARVGGKNLIIILNDNKMSISRNVGSLASSLNRMISGSRYNRIKTAAKRLLFSLPRHQILHRMIRRTEDTIKALILPGGIFQELGIRYIGPINGHDLPGLLHHFNHLKEQQDGPVLLHVITEKGRGCEFARRDPSTYHGVPGFDPASGRIPSSDKPTFSKAFGSAIVELAEQHTDVNAITAAMIGGTGLGQFARRFPSRLFDVGITEAHAVTFASGLATAGLRPVCAIYATFLQRALDCIYHDVVLPQLPVIFAIDRAGVVEDGPTHHGIYNLGFLRSMPQLTIMAPRSEAELRKMLFQAYELARPVAIRYPRGGSSVPPEEPPEPLEYGKMQLVREGAGPVILALGPETDTALAAAEKLDMDCCVVNVRYLAPFDADFVRKLAASGRTFATIEDHVLSGGLASAVDEALANAPHGRLLHFGWPCGRIIPHGNVSKLREEFGLTPEAIAEKMRH